MRFLRLVSISIVAGLVGLIATASPAAAQYAEAPRVLASADAQVRAATQIGRDLFVAGGFTRVGPPTGGAVAVDAAGTFVAGAFPRVDGPVHDIAADGLGGWLVAGAFTAVNGEPRAGLVRVGADRVVDPRYRVVADGPLRQVRIAHGRIYLVGDFSRVNGAPRHGLAALDAATGALSSWGAGFDPGVDASTGRPRALRNLAVSSTAVYVAGGGSWSTVPVAPDQGRIWGFDAGSGTRLFEHALFVTAIAATSRRVYVGGWGYQRPLAALDPRSGTVLPWTPGLTFLPVGSIDSHVTSLLLDETRLYLGGLFRTTDGQMQLAAIDAASGAPTTWRPETLPPSWVEVSRLTRLGPAVVAFSGGVANGFSAYDAISGLSLPWNPGTHGRVLAVAPAPTGAILGGDFNGIDGAPAGPIAVFDLDTGQPRPWSVTPAPAAPFEWIGTDGTHLLGLTEELPRRFLKIDAASGAVLASLTVDVPLYTFLPRVAGDRLVVVADTSVLGVIHIPGWTVTTRPLTLGGFASNVVSDFDVVGDVAYLGGTFGTVNGVTRPFLAAVSLSTGTVLPFVAAPDAEVVAVRVGDGRLWVGGKFRRIGGTRRRGLASLDVTTAQAGPWNPDAPGGARLDLGSGATLVVSPAGVLGGRADRVLAALAPSSARPLPWRPRFEGFLGFTPRAGVRLGLQVALTADCLVPTERTTLACYPRALPAPGAPVVAQADDEVTLGWTLPGGPVEWDAVVVEVGSAEGRSDRAAVTLAPTATSISGELPPGPYAARVRTRGAASASLPTPDVSFAVGPPAVPGVPLDPVATTEGTRLTVAWQPPSVAVQTGFVLEAGTAPGLADVARLPLAASASSLTIEAPPGRYWSRLRAANAAGPGASSLELVLDVEATSSPCYGTPPLAPLALSGAVAGGAVTLGWTQPATGPVANLQRILVGSDAGLSDLAAMAVPGPATELTVSAPPGRYYVRVVAVNDCGTSAPSNEIVVTVP